MINTAFEWRTWMIRLLSRRWLWVSIFVGGAVVAWMMYRQARSALDISDPDRARSQGKPIPVRTATVVATEAEQVIGATALTAASSEATLRAVSPGQGTNTVDMIVKSVKVREGDRVRRGQVLFEVDDEVRAEAVVRLEAALIAAEAEHKRVEQSVVFNDRTRRMELASSEGNLQFRTTDLDNRTGAFEIVEKLFRDRASSTLEYYESRSRYEQARYEIKEAERRL